MILDSPQADVLSEPKQYQLYEELYTICANLAYRELKHALDDLLHRGAPAHHARWINEQRSSCLHALINNDYLNFEEFKALFQRLVEQQADLTAKSGNFTLLMQAAVLGKTAIVAWLIDTFQREVRVNEQTPFGDTALHFAARKGYLDTVQSLLQRHANPLLVNDRGQRPGDSIGHPAMRALLPLSNSLTETQAKSKAAQAKPNSLQRLAKHLSLFVCPRRSRKPTKAQYQALHTQGLCETEASCASPRVGT